MSIDGKLKSIQGLTGKFLSFGIDQTLTKKGMCADAKTTGDEIRTLKNRIDKINPRYAENIYYNYENNETIKGVVDTLMNTIGFKASKNLLENKLTSRTVSGVTFTVNEDKSISLSGTATSEITLTINSTFTLEKGKYRFSGFPINYTDDSFMSSNLALFLNDGVYKLRGGVDSINVSVGEKTTATVEMLLVAGTPCDGVTLYPMIQDANIEDNNYEAYAPNIKVQLEKIYSLMEELQ